MIEHIYICRHGFRSSSQTTIWHNVTGTPEDYSLSAYGIQQADELASFLLSQKDHPIEAVFSSPYYRCLQTIEPFSKAAGLPIHIEQGFSEFYRPIKTETDVISRPATKSTPELAKYFSPGTIITPDRPPSSPLEQYLDPMKIPNPNGETVPQLRERVAFTLQMLIYTLEKKYPTLRSIVICTHAAIDIVIGRVLLNDMSKEIRCGCATVCHYRRIYYEKNGKNTTTVAKWDILLNGSHSHLSGGEERNWSFEDIAEEWQDVDTPAISNPPLELSSKL